MKEAIKESVLRLYAEGCSIKEIERRTNISHSTITKVLVSYGDVSTPEKLLFDKGMSISEIAAMLEKSEKAVKIRLPYIKGPYDRDNPTENALRIRKCRERKKQ